MVPRQETCARHKGDRVRTSMENGEGHTAVRQATLVKAEGGTATSRLRELLKRTEIAVAPGVGDAVTARLAGAQGFEALYMSGAWASALRGFPDVGLITLGEMVQAAAYIANAVDVPVISDADTGFGDTINVHRCVREFERAGVAGIHIEDQASPKKCGLLSGKKIVDANTMVKKIQVALGARDDPDFVIIARTDSLQSEGVDGAIARGRQYLDAGADVLFVEGFKTEEEVEAVGSALGERPLLFNQTPAGYGPVVEAQKLWGLGFRLIIYPLQLVLLSAHLQREWLKQVSRDGRLEDGGNMISIEEFFNIVDGDNTDAFIASNAT